MKGPSAETASSDGNYKYFLLEFSTSTSLSNAIWGDLKKKLLILIGSSLDMGLNPEK
jgi:hypothetical protein